MGTERGIRWGLWARRVLVAALTALMLAAGGLAWWIESTERAWQRHVAVGRGIVGLLEALERALARPDGAQLAGFLETDLAGGAPFEPGPRAMHAGIEVTTWAAGRGPATRDGWVQALLAWRADRPWIEQLHLRLHQVDAAGDASATGVVRLDAIGRDRAGRRFTDRAKLDATFARAERWRIAGLALRAGHTTAGPGDHFVEEAQQRGIAWTLAPDPRLFTGGPIKHIYQVIRHAYSGALCGDFDGDGLQDALLLGGRALALFRNTGGARFVDATAASGLAGIEHVNTGLVADLDNDGVLDLYLARYYGPDLMLRGNGDGTFTDMTAGSGLGGDDAVSSMTSADFDRDGLPDLYLGKFLEGRDRVPETYLYSRNGPPNVQYRNLGALKFCDVSAAAGTDDTGLTASTSSADYDGDGDVDLWCVNDYGRNVLYRNRGDGTFEDVTRPSGTLTVNPGMSAHFADYDNDGRLDFYISGIGSHQLWYSAPVTPRRFLAQGLRKALTGQARRKSGGMRDVIAHFGSGWEQLGVMSLSGNYLWRNQGDGTFENASAKAVQPPGWYWSSGFFDVDNDGWLDILALNGWVTGSSKNELDFAGASGSGLHEPTYIFSDAFLGTSSWHGNERDVLLVNRRDGTFVDAGAALGADSIGDGRGLAAADYDNDGDVDFLITNHDRPAELRMNRRGAEAAWLQVELVGSRGPRDPVGAQVHLRAGGHHTVASLAAGQGFGSQFSRVLHFGLGARTQVDEVSVRWPSGGRTTLRDIGARRRLRVIEP